MTSVNRKRIFIQSLVWIVCCTALFSFSTHPGGDSFEIYVNNSMVIQQYVHRDVAVKNLSLQDASASDVIKVYYNHCGRVGTAKTIAVKDSQNRTLKSWEFADGDKYMTFKVQEIAALQKQNAGTRLNLFYSAKEMPSGRVLAAITNGNEKARLE
jgi:hypothetical protein